ncbi:DNA repair protein RecO [Marivibrio halodurans]|uniref:DNA repair protein RecO n=1 Tax=Marivibrio halodurans TaxID=2039722 RepID=A0A8J7RZM8_9PROT|nr:DNA repair protein RecO [Marivibrio halodurans]MBP5855989.1 DNA repair protein RecO [Marivibrio halodurans]
MEWRDDGIILSVRRHGENGAVVSLLTRARGRHAGLVRGGQSRRMKGMLQPGNRVEATWRARLEEHLGAMSLEPVASHAAALMMDSGRLAALSSALSLIDTGLPEREPHPEIFDDLAALLVALEAESWAETYARWEVGLLAELGFGLDLSACAATGVTEDLTYVSPRTGRAVSTEAARPYRERLLPLPAFLLSPRARAGAEALGQSLRLTGYFLARHVLDLHGKPLPDARARLERRFDTAATTGTGRVGEGGADDILANS